ncbi:RcnB family protein [Sodalis sp. dw_96]|uniref:RcnB family protein n=1 Tax=Sodalis sp. dw_96 TaxID=2719794 RepID=UPI001BD1D201|nr:RcnB family protein [Sodalis sp. dw_96]
MGQSKVVLLSSVLFIGALPFVSSAHAEDGQGVGVPTPPSISSQTPPTGSTQNPPTDSSQTPPAGSTQNPPADSTQNPPAGSTQNPPAVHSYEIQSFYLDSKQYKLGDIVPDLYRTKPYEIVQWNIRNLPAPEEGSHWTYMGGNYVLITNDDGKILKAETGDIFFQM